MLKAGADGGRGAGKKRSRNEVIQDQESTGSSEEPQQAQLKRLALTGRGRGRGRGRGGGGGKGRGGGGGAAAAAEDSHSGRGGAPAAEGTAMGISDLNLDLNDLHAPPGPTERVPFTFDKDPLLSQEPANGYPHTQDTREVLSFYEYLKLEMADAGAGAAAFEFDCPTGAAPTPTTSSTAPPPPLPPPRRLPPHRERGALQGTQSLDDGDDSTMLSEKEFSEQTGIEAESEDFYRRVMDDG